MKEKYSSIDIQTTFQSRFGPQEWLTPYTDKTLERLPKEGVKNLLVICPGFASDCVETLEEINIQGRDTFLKNGGKNFELIPCLNDSSDHIDLFEKLVKKYI
jgi:ferrochelatase